MSKQPVFVPGSAVDMPIRSIEYPEIRSVGALYEALKECWCAETCAPRMRVLWKPENRTLGQCSVTAFLVQDLLGGKVYGVPLPDGNFHCYNVVEDQVIDLTAEQFGDEKLNYEGNPEQLREDHFAKAEKLERYELLKDKLVEWCAEPEGQPEDKWGRVLEKVKGWF